VRIIDKMMAKEAARRFQTPSEVVAALEPFANVPLAPPTDAEMPPSALAGCGKPLSQFGQPTAIRTSSTPRSPDVRSSDVLLPGTPLPVPAPGTPPTPARKLGAVSK
jgi:hypothetical protein